MLSNIGFDLWADGYDKSVGIADDNDTYPFAGYKRILADIYAKTLLRKAKKVLDIGFGTAALTAKLYENGCEIFGQDFSKRMTEIAKEKMPKAHLFCADFTNGLCLALRERKYDAIIATYSLHHLTDEQKISFITELFLLLNENGAIFIGDVAFENRAELEKYREFCGDEWDDEEYYFVFSELQEHFPNAIFEKLSNCAGVLMLEKTSNIN